jgi:hypothetical protein
MVLGLRDLKQKQKRHSALQCNMDIHITLMWVPTTSTYLHAGFYMIIHFQTNTATFGGHHHQRKFDSAV